MDIRLDIGHPAADDPEGEILARHVTIHELRLRVGVDEPLGLVSIDIGRSDGIHSTILAPGDALNLAHRLIQACVRLRHADAEPAGAFSSQCSGAGRDRRRPRGLMESLPPTAARERDVAAAQQAQA